MSSPRILPWLATLALLGPGCHADDSRIAYPQGYRDWTHVKSMLIQAGHPLYGDFGGLHHLYANAAALEGYRQGHFPDGSVIVFDLLEAEAAQAAIHEGKRKVLGVMVKDQQRHAATGGWGFEAFAAGDSRRPVVGDQAAQACFQCHTAQQEHDYVFSHWRD